MCGIIGFVGAANAKNIILKGLHSLEYRGYDSAGLALRSDDGFYSVKCSGKVSELEFKCKAVHVDSSCGIGHTRWATHGAPTVENAHPHSSEKVILVHNGIIDNCDELKKELISDGYVFKSETDTECIAHLLDREYKKAQDEKKAIINTQKLLRGSFAIAVMFVGGDNGIWATKRDNPLVAVKSDIGSLIASDIPAVIGYSDKIIRIKDDEIIRLSASTVTVYDECGNEKTPAVEKIDWSIDAAQKDGYPHYMLKEMFEQPQAVKRTASKFISKEFMPSLENIGLSDDVLKSVDSISVVACGSAMHSGLVGKHIIERLSKIPVLVTTASEYRYDPPVSYGNTLVVAVSQSGETADTLAALRLSKKLGYTSLGIINTVGSAIASESDFVLYTDAGTEIAVATTKGYITQLVAFYLLALALAKSKKTLIEAEIKSICNLLINDVPEKISNVLSRRCEIEEIAKHITKSNDLYYIGRGIDYSCCLESSLKLKEISYIHSEAYAAGELKHGTLSLVTKGVPVVAVATDDKYYDKMIGNIREVKARLGSVILVCKKDFPEYERIGDMHFALPDVSCLLSPLVSVVFSQMLAYETALLRKCDIDKPRNLAKSVTVE